MTIREFIEKANNENFDIMNELQVKVYLPIAEKKLIAKGIIYECTEKVDGVIKIDSVQQYLSYVKYMITRHTNLEYTNEDYDALCSTGLLNTIMECFGEDAAECSRILNLMIDDYMQENSMVFVVGKFLSNLGDMLKDKLDSFDMNSVMPKDVNKEKVINFLNTYVK